MLKKTRGIVFKTMKYSETSIICDIYTEEYGLLSFIISGVRKKNAKTHAGLFQIMSMLDLVAYVSDKKKLHRIKEVKASYIYQSIPFNVYKSAVGQFMIEICKNAIRESEMNQELFRFIHDSYLLLDQTKNSVNIYHHVFLAKLASYIGFTPNNNFTHENPLFSLQEGCFVAKDENFECMDRENSEHMHSLLNTDLEKTHTLQLAKANRSSLLNQLIKYYQLHIENFKPVQSHLILQEVFEK